MTDTTDIRPISDFLAPIVGQSPENVKERLGIGRLFGLRSDLVHNGKLDITREQLGEVTEKLENICIEIMRRISGESYRGTLNKYFQ